MAIFLSSKKGEGLDVPGSYAIEVGSHLRMDVAEPRKDFSGRKREERGFFTLLSGLGEKPSKDPAVKRQCTSGEREPLYHSEKLSPSHDFNHTTDRRVSNFLKRRQKAKKIS
jgi:hypothetical protein